MVSSTPRPHFTLGKDPVSILQEAGWAPGLVWKGGKSRPHRDSIPHRPARSSVAIPTELPGPHIAENIYHKTQYNSTYPDADYPDRHGPSGKFVKNSTKLTCLEITAFIGSSTVQRYGY